MEDLPDLVKRLTAGMAVLLLDGCAKGIAFFGAGPQVPLGGRAGRGGQPARLAGGLCDLLRVNLSLLRRLVRTDDLVLEVAQADTAAGTEYAICYCRAKQTLPWCARYGRPLPLQAGAAAGQQLFCTVAPAQPGTAVHSGQLHPAPGGGFGQTVRGPHCSAGQRQPVGHGAAGALL